MLLIESEKLCGEIEHYCLNVENMTMDDVAEVVRRMLPLIHAEASGEPEEAGEKKRSATELEALELKSLHYESKKRATEKNGWSASFSDGTAWHASVAGSTTTMCRW